MYIYTMGMTNQLPSLKRATKREFVLSLPLILPGRPPVPKRKKKKEVHVHWALFFIKQQRTLSVYLLLDLEDLKW